MTPDRLDVEAQSALPPPAVAAIWAWRNAADRSRQEQRERRAAAVRRGLLQGVVGLAAAALLGWLWRPAAGWVVAGVALALLALALLSPLGAHRRATGFLEGFGRAVGAGVGWALMTALYLLVITPLGWFLRARGRLRVTTGFDPRLPSYWTMTGERRKAADYRRQF